MIDEIVGTLPRCRRYRPPVVLIRRWKRAIERGRVRRAAELLSFELEQLVMGQGQEGVVVFDSAQRLELAAQSATDEGKPRRNDHGGEDRFNEQKSPA